MAGPNGAHSAKRKQPPTTGRTSRPFKRNKVQDARTIATQTSGRAFGNGELDVEKFVQAREFEIKALERSIKKSRSALSSRAFQSVPRELRRRTASHNVKRIPQRLRARAKVEMREDNTPTVNAKTRKAKTSGKGRLRLDIAGIRKRDSERTKARKLQKKNERLQTTEASKIPRVKANQLQRPAAPKAKFRKRQRFKAWLPTHPFHAKRAHMPPAKEPLWRMAIPLSPTQKCYRPTHRATHARGAMAWDMSYISTIGLLGQQRSIVGVLKALGVATEFGGSWSTGKAARWMRGSRVWDGWAFLREAQDKVPIAPITVMWRTQTNTERDAAEAGGKPSRRQVFIRVHPSAFLQLWTELLKVSKIQKPAVAVEDLRFEIGSIQVSGPAASEALVGALWPVQNAGSPATETDSAHVWKKLRCLSNPAQLPAGTVLGFNVVDPRLHHPPRTVDTKLSDLEYNDLMQLLASWPLDDLPHPQQLFDRSARVLASRQLPSQKSINRRKGEAAPGAYPVAIPKDPQIPILAFVTKQQERGQAAWNIMLPWKCVTPVWYSLMYYPLSTGGTLRFGGLDQIRQVSFEAGMPWFPGDFLGTLAGQDWEATELKKRKAAFDRQPRGRRREYDTVDLGRGRKGEIGTGWACDWDKLWHIHYAETETSSPSWRQIPKLQAKEAVKAQIENTEATADVSNGLAAVNIRMLKKGIVDSCARVYRLPTNDHHLRNRWMEKSRMDTSGQQQRNVPAAKPQTADPVHARRQQLAAELLGKVDHCGEGEELVTPDEVDLIGFVTTSNFNLSEGIGTSVGSIVLERVLQLPASTTLSAEDFQESRQLCIVRDSGQNVCRLARWELA